MRVIKTTIIHTIDIDDTLALWAASVIADLGLTKYFDLVMTKPQFMWDDKDPKEWTRICYIK